MSTTKEEAFTRLLNSVNNCDLCERLCNRRKVLSKFNGSLYSKVLFIAEAPGRLGAECTGIPLYGDKTGDNFELLLNNIGWTREDIFITNAILCNPQDENGNNSTPKKEELINCSAYLDMTIRLIAPQVIVTLGAKALEALKLIHNHDFSLKADAGTKRIWGNYVLFPMYHTGPRALVHRPLASQRSDFIKLSHFVNPFEGLKEVTSTKKCDVKRDNKLLSLIKIIIDFYSELSLFKLTKLLYLIDYNFLKEYGKSLSGSIFLRMQEGPWIPSLSSLIKADCEDFTIHFYNKKPYVKSQNEGAMIFEYPEDEKYYIYSILEKYSHHTDAELKTAVYLTEPMKYILEQEKRGENMTKVPVLYKDDTVVNLHVPK